MRIIVIYYDGNEHKAKALEDMESGESVDNETYGLDEADSIVAVIENVSDDYAVYIDGAAVLSK